MSVTTTEPARPTTAGTETGSPAREVAVPGRAPAPGGRAYTVGRIEDVPPGEGRAFVAGDTQVAVFRLRDGSLHATQASCPHAGGPLADGQTDADILVCPLHLYAYRWVDGVATSGSLAVQQYPVREVDGMLVVDV